MENGFQARKPQHSGRKQTPQTAEGRVHSGSSLRRMCLLSPSQLSALLFRILSNLNNLGSCFCFIWAEMLEQQQLKNKKKNPPANAGDIDLIP